MGFDPVTYAVAKGAANAYTESLIGSVAQGFAYQGSVATFNDLPTPSASIKGHEYTVSTADESHPTGSYVCDGTAWVPLAVRGAQGIQGIQGVQGIPGIPGPQGTPGINGTNGRDGANGRDGRDGYVQYTAGEGIEISHNTISLSATTLRLVGSIDAAIQHTLPDATEYDNGAEIIVVSDGTVSRAIEFSLAAGQTLDASIASHANDLVSYGYTITVLDGATELGVLQSCTTDSLVLDTGTINLPYNHNITSSSSPATYDVDVVMGDMFIALGGAWTYLSNNGSVTSVNGETGAVTLTASDVNAIENTFVTSQTTAPVAAATDGGIHLVYLDSEPSTKYDGYLYFIKEA